MLTTCCKRSTPSIVGATLYLEIPSPPDAGSNQTPGTLVTCRFWWTTCTSSFVSSLSIAPIRWCASKWNDSDTSETDGISEANPVSFALISLLVFASFILESIPISPGRSLLSLSAYTSKSWSRSSSVIDRAARFLYASRRSGRSSEAPCFVISSNASTLGYFGIRPLSLTLCSAALQRFLVRFQDHAASFRTSASAVRLAKSSARDFRAPSSLRTERAESTSGSGPVVTFGLLLQACFGDG